LYPAILTQLLQAQWVHHLAVALMVGTVVLILQVVKLVEGKLAQP
jgi:hypothetical protein